MAREALPVAGTHVLVDVDHDLFPRLRVEEAHPRPLQPGEAAQIRHLERDLHQLVDGLLPSCGDEHVDVVVEDAAVADHHRVPRGGDNLLGDLGVEDPRL